jgi:hypothetical protein
VEDVKVSCEDVSTASGKRGSQESRSVAEDDRLWLRLLWGLGSGLDDRTEVERDAPKSPGAISRSSDQNRS